MLDGFDYALAGAGLTRNLWDQLRSLAQKTSLRFVTGSRRPLRELCRTEESRTSDFWEIFYDTPIRVAALDDADWVPFLEPLLAGGRTLDDPARKEIVNWTGGVPLFVCALLQKLWERFREKSLLSKPEIDQAAGKSVGRNGKSSSRSCGTIAMWSYALILVCLRLAKSHLPIYPTAAAVRLRVEDSAVCRRIDFGGSCRFMQRYADARAPALSDLKHLFDTALGFETHIRSLLELRLAQVAGPEVDRDLCGFVRNAVRDIEPDPDHALVWVRSIAERALSLIWGAELPPDRTLPADWIEDWRHAGVRNWPEDAGKLPHGTGPQCGVLRLITGTDRVRRQSRFVTRTTCLLVDHLQSVGNFAQHRASYPETNVSIGFAAASVLAAISLVENLTADLHR